MRYWLMKSEPDVFGISDLAGRPRRTEHWDGVRNFQARNFLRDDMKKGDLAYFYHSSCAQPGIAGIVEIVRAGYPDDSAWNPKSPYIDPKSTLEKPIWYRVDVKLARVFERLVTLNEIKAQPALRNMPLVQRGSRLSVMPVTTGEWHAILGLAKTQNSTPRRKHAKNS
jgi:predicted RNA-binding protein with PUA-like domain